MFGNYKRIVKQMKYENVHLSDFLSGVDTDKDANILPIKVATTMYNFDYSNGALTTGMGLQPLYLPHSDDPEHTMRTMDEFPCDVERAWLYRYYDYMGNDWSMIVAYGVDGYLYTCFVQSFESGVRKETRIKFSSCPTAINYRLNGQDVLILCNKKDGMVIWDANYAGNAPTVVKDAPKISSMCVQFDKLFACQIGDKSQVWYSDDFDPTNWNTTLNEAGYLTMIDEKGRLNKVLAFKEYVYVFRDYGISRISKTTKNTFAVQQLYHSNSRIFPESVVVAGDTFMMLMEDGLYAFDGLNYKKVELPLLNLFESGSNSKAEGVFHNGKYYLACNLVYTDNEEGQDTPFNTLLEYDLETGVVCLLRAPIVSLCACHNEVFSKLLVVVKHDEAQVVTVLEKNGEILGTPLHKKWQSPMTSLGKPNTGKYIKEVCLITKYDCQMTITTEKESKTFSLTGKEYGQIIPVKMKAKSFSIAFTSTEAEAYISSPTIVVGYAS